MYMRSIQELHQQLRSKITAINHLSKLTKEKISKTFILQNKDLKNKSFKYKTDISHPSILLAFLSLQMHHIRQQGIALQISILLMLTNWLDQLA